MNKILFIAQEICRCQHVEMSLKELFPGGLSLGRWLNAVSCQNIRNRGASDSMAKVFECSFDSQVPQVGL